ncbi:MAG: class I SAM-dependent methyltransferase [Bdellovibrionales bacterium]|nr:class I SAM-dependent methyltransferase [Bdellovibrionales bacterium]
MENFWDNRYRAETYVYGKEANTFVRDHLIDYHPGHILFPADGEGRNSTFAAENGWKASAFDFSSVAQKKALELAKEKRVAVNFTVDTLQDYNYPTHFYDAVALIFVHFGEEEYESIFEKLCRSLKPGGLFLFQAYSKQQLGRLSGGPQKIELLYSTKSLMNLNAFEALSFKKFEECEVNLNEGPYHQGLASVIQFVAVKKNLP